VTFRHLEFIVNWPTIERQQAGNREINPFQMTSLTDMLLQQGLIEEHDEHTQTSRIKVIRLTEQGCQALSKHGAR